MLVLKNNNVEYSEDAQKLYKGARVNQGTLLALDYSSRTCVTINKPLSKNNLPKDLSEKGIEIDYTFSEPKELTAKKGLHISQNSTVATVQHGLIFKEVMSYILANPTHKIGVTIWLERDSEIGGTGERILRCLNGLGNLDLSINATSATFRIAGSSHTQSLSNNTNRIVQYGMTYDPTLMIARRCVNGVVVGAMTTPPTGWLDLGDLGIGKLNTSETSRSPVIMYRMLIEDLTISQQSDSDFIVGDYNYVNALGEYLGIEKRPYNNI